MNQRLKRLRPGRIVSDLNASRFMAMAKTNTNSTWMSRLGAGLSVACAIHCALTPLLVGLLPLLGLTFLSEERTETWIVGVVVVLAIGSALWGFKRHRALRAVMAFAGAVGLLLMGRWLGHNHPLGVALTVAGGVAIAGAHWLSARLCKTCPSHAGVAHEH